MRFFIVAFYCLVSVTAVAAFDPSGGNPHAEREALLVDQLQDETLPLVERVHAAGALAVHMGPAENGYQPVILNTLYTALRKTNSVALRVETLEVVKAAAIKLGLQNLELLPLFERALNTDPDERVKEHAIEAIREVALSHQNGLQHKLFDNPSQTEATRNLVSSLATILSRVSRQASSPSIRQKAHETEMELVSLVQFAAACETALSATPPDPKKGLN